MGYISFDDDVADALIRASRQADDALRSGACLRRSAVEIASDDFRGVYAQLFHDACSIEAADRGRLAHACSDLADDVERAKTRARSEKDRLEALASWTTREGERDERRRREGVLGDIGASVDEMFDRRPCDPPVKPPTVSATFSAQQRTRAGSGRRSSTSSADPDDLRTFVWQSQAASGAAAAELMRLRSSWQRFRSACEWVPIDRVTLFSGYDDFLSENDADATWIEHVALAFDAAGGGSLSNAALDLAATSVSPMSNSALLAALASLPEREAVALLKASAGLRAQLQGIDPVVVFDWWSGMDPAPGSIVQFSKSQVALLEAVPDLFGNLEGIPYGARDFANRLTLKTSIADLKKYAEKLRAEAGSRLLSESEALNLSQFESQLATLVNIRSALTSSKKGAARFLISLVPKSPPLAAVSIGDLDTATNVTYAVPGMDTTTANMVGWAKAAQNLHSRLRPGSAVVAWIGYETPRSEKLDVRNANRAIAGAARLAGAWGGLAAVRAGEMPKLNVVAHSYGTTTAAAAMSHQGVRVDNFITLGSAGLPDNVHSAADLDAAHVYAGHARDKAPGERESGDQWASIGRETSRDHKVDPMDADFGSQPFGVDAGGDNGRPVTDHSVLMSDHGDEAGYLDQRTESIHNVSRVIRGEKDSLTPYTPLGLTEFQKGMRRGAIYVP